MALEWERFVPGGILGQTIPIKKPLIIFEVLGFFLLTLMRYGYGLRHCVGEVKP